MSLPLPFHSPSTFHSLPQAFHTHFSHFTPLSLSFHNSYSVLACYRYATYMPRLIQYHYTIFSLFSSPTHPWCHNPRTARVSCLFSSNFIQHLFYFASFKPLPNPTSPYNKYLTTCVSPLLSYHPQPTHSIAHRTRPKSKHSLVLINCQCSSA